MREGQAVELSSLIAAGDGAVVAGTTGDVLLPVHGMDSCCLTWMVWFVQVAQLVQVIEAEVRGCASTQHGELLPHLGGVVCACGTAGMLL